MSIILRQNSTDHEPAMWLKDLFNSTMVISVPEISVHEIKRIASDSLADPGGGGAEGQESS